MQICDLQYVGACFAGTPIVLPNLMVQPATFGMDAVYRTGARQRFSWSSPSIELATADETASYDYAVHAAGQQCFRVT